MTSGNSAHPRNRVGRSAVYIDMGRVVLAALLIITLAACDNRPSMLAERVEYQADYPMYDSLAALHERATVVVAGEVRPSPAVRELEALVCTVYVVRVDRRFKGAAPDTIEVKQGGGTLGGTTFVEAGGIPLRPGQRYVLFLETYPDSPASLLNPSQGQYVLEAGDRPAPVDPAGFTFTLAELEALP